MQSFPLTSNKDSEAGWIFGLPPYADLQHD